MRSIVTKLLVSLALICAPVFAQQKIELSTQVKGTTLPLSNTTDLYLSRYAAKQLMISGDGVGATTNAGLILGYSTIVSGMGLIGPSTAAPNLTTVPYIGFRDQYLNINGGNGATGIIITASGNQKMAFSGSNGAGPSITAGAATADENALNITQTWNNAAVTFTAIKSNVTATTSAADSMLLDLQVGGLSRFKVEKNGYMSGLGFTTYRGNGGATVGSSGNFAWSDNPAPLSGTLDVVLARDAAGTLAQRNGTNAQTFNIYSTYTDASNYERGSFRWDVTYGLVYGTQALGAGTARNMKLDSASYMYYNVPTSRSHIFTTNNAGGMSMDATALYPNNNEGLNLGGPSTAWKQLYLGKTITAPATTGAQTINKSSGRVNFAAAATSLVVTNSLVDANSICTATAATADATGYVTSVVAAAGSFTINVIAPAAEMAVNFRCTN